MKVGFNFSNLLGTVYCRGNVVFTPDGNSLLSPVGNRITCFDLINNKSFTFAFEHRKNISRIALNPQATLLLSVDEDGRAILTNFLRRVVLHRFNFKSEVHDIQFSPDGRYFAVACGRKTQIWRTPNIAEEREFAPFVKHHEHMGHYDVVNSITWSSDSRFFLTASKDLTARIWSLDAMEGFQPTTLSSHKEQVIGAWFSKDQETIYTCSADGALCEWKYTVRPDLDEDEVDERGERWFVVNRHYFKQADARVKCATFHKESGLLVTGFSNGVFGLYELPDFSTIHTLSISQNGIDFVTVNTSGEWLAFGASKLGQLLVWEWQSESYVLKQQGHFDAMNSLVYSPDGQRIITTADDGKIKVWDAVSGFCIVTFTEHTSGVTACEFGKRGNVLFTASLDGSVRAWDLVRYRNFRTFTAPSRVQFSCLAIDPSGEVVTAGGIDSFDVHVWSVQTGQLLERLSGHEGPVSSLAFAPDGGNLVSGSWDCTVRVWSIFTRTQTSEPFQQQTEVLNVAYRPDSVQIAVSTSDGQLSFWNVEDGEQTSHIAGKADISGGRKAGDRFTAANNAGTKNFTTLTYSADGTCVLAAGNSKYICLYDVASGSLVRKFTVSSNLSLDGTQEFLNSKNLTEAGPVELLDTAGEAEDLQERMDRSLPGATRGDMSKRKARPEVRVTGLAFTPSGRGFAAASTEGLLIYSLDNVLIFDPVDLDVEVTPSNILSTLNTDKDYLKALIMAFRLNERYLIHQVLEAIPVDSIQLIVSGIPVLYIQKLLRYIALLAEETPHVEFWLIWMEAVLTKHGRTIKAQREYDAEMIMVQKSVARMQTELRRIADENVWTIDYLLGAPREEERGRVELLRVTEGKGEDGDVEMADGESEDEGEWMGIEE